LIRKGLHRLYAASAAPSIVVGTGVALIGTQPRLLIKACSHAVHESGESNLMWISGIKETAMRSHTPNVEPPSRAFDVTRRFVRVRQQRNDGFVEFDFSIGDPGLSVELVMTLPDYESFCTANRVVHLTHDEAEALDLDQLKWRYGRPGLSE
jgi:phenol hydroxylase P0 protein